MNLTEVLNYRTNCPLCSKPLCIKSENTFNNITLKNEGFRIFAGENYVDFNFDGTIVSSPNYNYQFDINLETIDIKRYCKKCVYPFNSRVNDIGTIILKHIKKKAYYYSFNLKIGDGTFEPALLRENFMQIHGGSYYFVDNMFPQGEMSIQKMRTLNDRVKLNLTAKDLSTYADDKALRSLVNTYLLFS